MVTKKDSAMCFKNMTKDEILSILENMKEESDNAFIGSNESELDFIWKVSEWIYKLQQEKNNLV